MTVNGGGATNPPIGTHLFAPGAIVSISAIPTLGWQFSHWTNNVANPASSTTTVTMNDNQSVTAYFVGVSIGPSDLPTVTPTARPTLTPMPRPTITPLPTIRPTLPLTPTPHATQTPNPTFTPLPTPVITQSPTLTPPYTPIPGEEPTQVPWALIGVTVAAIVGAGVLFYVLRQQVGASK